MQRCTQTFAAIVFALCLVAPLTARAAEPAWKAYNNPSLGVTFPVRPAWSGSDCSALDVIGKCIAFKTADTFNSIVYVTVEAGTLTTAVEHHILFERGDGKWVKIGRVGKADATPIYGDHWTGIYAVTTCPVEDPELGTLWSAGECLTAIVSDGTRVATIETLGSAPPDEVLDHIVRGFRFTEK